MQNVWPLCVILLYTGVINKFNFEISFKVCLFWKFCPFKSTKPPADELIKLAYSHKLGLSIDLKLSLLNENIEKEAKTIDRKFRKDFQAKLIKEKELKEREKYFNDIVYLFYPRHF